MSYDKHFKKMKNKNNPSQPQQPSKAKKATGKSEMNIKKSIAKKKDTPWGLFISLILGTMLSFLGYQNLDHVDDFISKVEVNFLGQATAAEGKTPVTSPNPENSAADTVKAATAECAPATQPNSEELSHYSKLSERKQQLDLREQELAKLEEELQKQKAEVEDRISKLESIRTEISGVLKEKVEVDEQRVTTLVDFYSNMKPKQAAEVFNSLNEDLAVEVLGRMKKKNAAEIMNLLEPTKARILSEKFTGYKKR